MTVRLRRVVLRASSVILVLLALLPFTTQVPAPPSPAGVHDMRIEPTGPGR